MFKKILFHTNFFKWRKNVRPQTSKCKRKMPAKPRMLQGASGICERLSISFKILVPLFFSVLVFFSVFSLSFSDLYLCYSGLSFFSTLSLSFSALSLLFCWFSYSLLSQYSSCYFSDFWAFWNLFYFAIFGNFFTPK